MSAPATEARSSEPAAEPAADLDPDLNHDRDDEPKLSERDRQLLDYLIEKAIEQCTQPSPREP